MHCPCTHASIHVYLEWLLSSVDQLMSLQLGAFNKCLSTLCTDVDPGTMRMKVFTHRSVVTKHLIAALSKEIGKK